MIPKWHWSNKPEKEKREILKRMSKGWFGGSNNKTKLGIKNRVKCKCLFCGKEFEVKKSRKDNGRGKFCSKKCFSNYRNILIDKECSYCKKKFKVSRANKKTKVYCSKECFSKGMSIKITGKKHSIKSRKKMSKFWKGKSRPWLIGKPGGMLGKKHNEKTKKELSKAKMKDKNPSWRGGISFEPYTPKFNNTLKKKIRKRDNYTCQFCGKLQKDELKQYNRRLPIHHIDYNKKNCEECNLITLCCGCNGKVNYDRLDWMNYFRDKLKNL